MRRLNSVRGATSAQAIISQLTIRMISGKHANGSLRLWVALAIGLMGLFFFVRGPDLWNSKEGLCPGQGAEPPFRCPNLLLQEGAKLHLYNTRLADVPGVNPIAFANLNEYVQFTKWQRSQGIRCPVLYLQQAYDAQGQEVLKARPGPDNMQGGAPDLVPRGPGKPTPPKVSKLVDAGRDDPPYNQNSYPAYDPQDQYIGLETPLDKMFHAPNNQVSPSAMDTTWGGEAYAEKLVKAGRYRGDEVVLNRGPDAS